MEVEQEVPGQSHDQDGGRDLHGRVLRRGPVLRQGQQHPPDPEGRGGLRSETDHVSFSQHTEVNIFVPSMKDALIYSVLGKTRFRKNSGPTMLAEI